MPAKNDDAVPQFVRVMAFAGKPRSYGTGLGAAEGCDLDDSSTAKALLVLATLTF